MDQAAKADHFNALHRTGEILLLANAWDAVSAAVIAEAGAKAVATSSAAVAWAHGYPDGDAVPVDKVLATVAEIARVVGLPVTADIEGGYTDDLAGIAGFTRRLIDAGAVGVNFEDGARDPELHARKIAAMRQAAEKAGVGLFINARTDVYLAGLAEGQAAYVETLRRAELYRQAGASGVFVPGPKDEDLIGRLASQVALPLNIMLLPGLAPAARLQALGVRRLSSATAPFRTAYAALATAVSAYLQDGDAAAFAGGGAGLGEGLANLNVRFGG